MKTSLAHLPEGTQLRLREIASLLQSEAPVDMLILFGSYARTDWVEDAEGGYFSDFDLLAVVLPGEVDRTNEAWGRLTERVRAIAGRTSATLIVHDIKELNHEIRLGQYFFIDILHEGICLHDSRRLHLAVPKALEPAERLDLALHNFRYWFGSANEFWRSAGNSAGRNLGPQSAFLLHQSVERYYGALNLVFTGYKPKSHKINELADEAAKLHPLLEGALPRADGEDKRLFDLLRRAYIEARYSKGYRITPDELAELRARVRDLATRVHAASLERMTAFCGPQAVEEATAAAHARGAAPLPTVPDLTDVGDMAEMPPTDSGPAFEAWKSELVAMGERRGFTRGNEEGESRGFARGKDEGLLEGQLRALLTILKARGLPIDDAARSKLDACRDPATLERWIAAAMTAPSLDHLLAAAPPTPPRP